MSESVLPPQPTGPSYEDAPLPPPPPRVTGTTTNGFAITSLVLAFLPATVVLSVIFGIIALVKTRRTGQRGRGLAIAGLSISGAWVLVLIAAVVIVSLAPAGDKAAVAVPAASNSVFAAQKGQCFTTYDELTSNIEKVPCDKPHHSEIYGLVVLPGDDTDVYPGDQTLSDQARFFCEAEQRNFFAATTPPSDLVMAVYYPDEGTWQHRGHSAVCTFESRNGALTAPVAH
ncbi:DUF4190 domain-containing protein [Amycolatopsis rhabdoformis]|uniref:DUF4190 domain-containing protein n=1 Tax=Amycolatopsis rhabdoformis TaxID=1448059 RepID=A0ABZ1HUL7_9PSEU|nr:DUF4190 domain-containing protein [Amycolatopsis rhabdoformis]WSE26055.1 DUF4190 domain-containing protein [Amycolatopsis rhabdoformis]